jgi:hypothetical protein
MGLSFTVAAGPRQRSHSQVRLPRDSWPHFTVSGSRLSKPGKLGPRIYNPQEQGSCFLSLLCQSQSQGQSQSQSQSQSYITTDGQPASLSWNKAPIWGLRPNLCYCQTVEGLFMWGALSDERTCLSIQLLLVLASAVILGSESRDTRDHTLLSQIRDFPFRRLLRLAGSRWRYSTPPPHGIIALSGKFLSFHNPVRTADRTLCLRVPLLFCLSVATVIPCCGNNVYLAVV